MNDLDETDFHWERRGEYRILRIGGKKSTLSLDRIVELLDACGDDRRVIQRSKRECVARAGTFVVKSFQKASALKKLFGAEAEGTKAFRAFCAACRLREHGVGTPPPVAVAEKLENGLPAESFLVTEYIENLSNFRDELNRIYAENPDCEALMALMRTVADACRAMHDAGVIHRDLGNQNIGLRKLKEGDEARDAASSSSRHLPSYEVLFLDLDRVRIFPAGTLTYAQRGRDLARIDLPSDFVRVFREMYFHCYTPPLAFREAEERERAAFELHTRLRPWRHPIREWKVRRRQEAELRANPNAPRVPVGKELWIWDERSTQAISAYVSKDRRKFRSFANILKIAHGVLAHGLNLKRNYAATLAESFREPIGAFSSAIGMTLDATPETWEPQLRFLAELESAAGAKMPILLRVYHHKSATNREFVIEKARELHTRGNSVALALVQDRAALRSPEGWREMVFRVVEATRTFADFYEIGHATNRGKWGIWDFSDYEKLLTPAIEAKRAFPHIRLTGPACIDFDLHTIFGLLDGVPAGTFSALSQHLYVDRRGAPENFQGRFDLVRKCAIHRAFAKTFGFDEEKIVVSEVNWPLRETGEYSPIDSPSVLLGIWGRPDVEPCTVQRPRVSEEEYAKYMCRYLLLAIASGHVSRVYWWRLMHRGFGLVDDADASNPRRRLAFEALKNLLAALAGTRFERRLDDVPAGTFALEFSRADGSRFAFFWNADSFPEIRNL